METLQGSCPHDLLTTLLTLAPAQPSANELNWKSAGEVVKLRTAAWSRASSQVGQITHYTQTHVFTSSSCGSRHVIAQLLMRMKWVGNMSPPIVLLWTGHCGHVETSVANRLIGEVVQSRRRPLLGPSPG